MSTAEKLWKDHHQNQVSRLQQQLREATPPGPSPSSPAESAAAAAIERALQEAREKWEEEQQAKMQETLDAAKQVHIEIEDES